MFPIKDDGIQYNIYDASELDEMAMLMAATFSRFDPPAVATGITSNEFEKFVKILSTNVSSNELTIIARSADTGEMAGALFTQDSTTPLPNQIESISKKFNPIFDILNQLGAEYWQGKEQNPGEYLHLFLLGISQTFAGRGIAHQLVKLCLENGIQKGYHVGVTEATNNISQHIFRKQGFVERVQLSYKDYRYQGKDVFASINRHVGPMLMDKKLI